MKIVAIMGNIRKSSQTKKVVEMFRKKLEGYEEIDFDYIELRNLKLEPCRACSLCLEKGRAFCPLKDDYNSIVEKMEQADGIIIATPNYTLQVTHLLKNFLDRSAHFCHRPQFFGKVFTSIVTQSVYGGKGINNYLEQVCSTMGGIFVKGITITVPLAANSNGKATWSDKEIEKAEKIVDKLALSFLKKSNKNRYPRPTVLKTINFRVSRTSHKCRVENNKDFYYFKEKGWFESNYYYETKIGVFKAMLGKIVDLIAKRMYTTK